MRKTCLAVSALVLAACGGGGTSFKDPNKVQFDYGNGTPVTGTTADDAAAAAAAGATAAQSLGDSSNAADAQTLLGVTSELGAVLGVSDGVGGGGAGLRLASPGAPSSAVDGGVEIDPLDPCVTVTATKVVFDHCVASGDGMTMTASGWVEVEPADASRRVTWDATWHLQMALDGETGTVNVGVGSHATGDLLVTSTAFTGFARTDNTLSASGQGQSLSAAYTDNVDYDLVLDPGQAYCVVEGTAELKHLWAERPSGVKASALPDVGVLVDWNACGSATVTWATL